MYDISICDPFVIESSNRRNDISCPAKPGFVGDDDRICDMCIIRPVNVARINL